MTTKTTLSHLKVMQINKTKGIKGARISAKPPSRRCIGCRQMLEKSTLIRIAYKKAQAQIQIDANQKAPGRGAYICNAANCIKQAIKSKGLNRAFKGNVPPDIYETLKGLCNE